MKVIHTRLTDRVAEEAQHEAEVEGLSISDVHRRALAQYLMVQRYRRQGYTMKLQKPGPLGLSYLDEVMVVES